jgi:hypothetical protein
MPRIGMTRDSVEDFNDPDVDEGPLRRHVLYRKDRTWKLTDVVVVTISPEAGNSGSSKLGMLLAQGTLAQDCPGPDNHSPECKASDRQSERGRERSEDSHFGQVN